MAIWDLEFHGCRAVNFGMAADRTENILYRLSRTDLATHPPRMFVLLAGTNNLSSDPPDSPEATVSAIQAIIEHITKRCPTSSIVVLTLPPNGYEHDNRLRQLVIETNRRLVELALPERARLIDIYPVFADEAHRWKPGMTIDGTHLSQRGYDYLARALKPVIDSLHPAGKAGTPY